MELEQTAVDGQDSGCDDELPAEESSVSETRYGSKIECTAGGFDSDTGCRACDVDEGDLCTTGRDSFDAVYEVAHESSR